MSQTYKKKPNFKNDKTEKRLGKALKTQAVYFFRLNSIRKLKNIEFFYKSYIEND